MIQAVLFDAGYCLVYPRTGNWFIPPRFEQYFSDEIGQLNQDEDIRNAFADAYRYLDENHHISTEEEELSQFEEFYARFLAPLNAPGKGQALYAAMAADCVSNTDKFVLFDDVIPALRRLSQNYRLGVISDTWPSLERVFRDMGIREYFDSFVMSSVLGVTKPHPLMYSSALQELSVEADNAVFIDDSVGNLRGAADVGINPIHIERPGGSSSAADAEPFPGISSLDGFSPDIHADSLKL